MDETRRKEELICKLGLLPHPEGGYFKELFHGEEREGRPLYSSILFLLGENDISHLHVLKEDEVWYYHEGKDCQIYEIDPSGKLTITSLGKTAGIYQHRVVKGNIFGSRIQGKGYSLVGCMVSPAFTYDHFHLVTEEELPKMKEEERKKVLGMILP